MAEDRKYVELIWYQKYDKLEKGERLPIEKPNLPFQVVETVNEPRIKGGYGHPLFSEEEWPSNYPRDWKNLLIWGDNKLVMSSLLKQGWAGRINLIYIDPPFFTGADFTVRTKLGREPIEKKPSIIEERAYKDTWSGGIASYLKYMYERLVLMRELLAETGSIYVHLDWHVGHYVKVMMDEIFGADSFKNEIVWRYRRWPAKSKNYQRMHDVILYYTKCNDNSHTFNVVEYEPLAETTLQADKGVKIVNIILPDGRRVRGKKSGEPSPGTLLSDVWEISFISATGSERMAFDTQKPEKLLKRIISFSSNPGDIVADFFAGSGTTLAVAEKLGRRWIGCDLSKFAIQVTRKRLLDIHNSKDLIDEKKKKYGKPARPFELWNIGNYETIYWREKEEEYLSFMLKLYQACPATGYRYIHGTKGERAVHIGPLNAPVTMEEIEKVIIECRASNFNKADVLGWEWSYQVNELAKELAGKHGVNLKLIQIPSVNEIKSALVGFDLQLLKVPDQMVEKELARSIRFYEVAYLEIETKIRKKELILRISDFQIPPTAEIEKIASRIKDGRELIDYWAVDWDYKGDTFHNQWQSFRTKKNPKVEYEARHIYKETGRYQVMVKVVDVFGNDTNKVLKIKI